MIFFYKNTDIPAQQLTLIKAFYLLETKIYKTRIMTSHKGGFTVSSKELPNHDSQCYTKRLLSNKTSLSTEQSPPHPSPSFTPMHECPHNCCVHFIKNHTNY